MINVYMYIPLSQLLLEAINHSSYEFVIRQQSSNWGTNGVHGFDCRYWSSSKQHPGLYLTKSRNGNVNYLDI